MNHVDPAFLARFQGSSLTTAEILYWMPDHKNILQQYIWQDYDIAPKFPKLFKFLDFWKKNLDGPLHKVIIVSKRLVTPAEVKLIQHEFQLH